MVVQRIVYSSGKKDDTGIGHMCGRPASLAKITALDKNISSSLINSSFNRESVHEEHTALALETA